MKVARIVLLVFSGLSFAWAGTVSLITNGDFESGTTAGWTATTMPAFGNTAGSCNAGFAAQSAATGCVPGTNPAFGTFAAYSSTSFPAIADDVGEWVNLLSQDFLVPSGITAGNLTFEYATTWAGSGSFRGVNVLAELLQGSTVLQVVDLEVNPEFDGSVSWTPSSTDVTSTLAANAGQILTLELFSLAFYDTRDPVSESSATTLNTGFDQVQITATTGVPEPNSGSLASGAFLLILAAKFARH